MERADQPRVVIAGLAGDAGKSLVALGLARTLGRQGLTVAPFKKGPDFIDAAWLSEAAGRACRNLDTFMIPTDTLLASMADGSREADIAIIEGNRGLFDGMDAYGTHSTAQLAKLTKSPVILVVDATKVTRTLAAQVLGCRAMDRDLDLRGVILNRVATERQEKVIRQAMSHEVDLPVVGAIPRLADQHLPSRHLGLVTAVEHPDAARAIDTVADLVAQHVDIEAVLKIAREAGRFPETTPVVSREASEPRVRIGVLKDAAFSFYYPENLEALERAGAELVPISPLHDPELATIDGLYAGGGFPEVHAHTLSQNESMRRSIADAIDDGLPVWAECGGMIYLSRAVLHEGAAYPMVGALPTVVEETSRPQGHGYVSGRIDRKNPFLDEQTSFHGHEFHYSRLTEDGDIDTVMALERGVGVGRGRDGIRVGNVVASYTHVHALGLVDWAPSLVRAAAGEAS